MSDDPCSICFDEIQSIDAEFLPCCHKFHAKCILPWISEHKKCPLCKISIYASHENVIQNEYSVNESNNAQSDGGQNDVANASMNALFESIMDIRRLTIELTRLRQESASNVHLDADLEHENDRSVSEPNQADQASRPLVEMLDATINYDQLNQDLDILIADRIARITALRPNENENSESDSLSDSDSVSYSSSDSDDEPLPDI